MQKRINCILILCALIISFNSCKQKGIVTGKSMISTLEEGDLLDLDFSFKELTYGDIILFEFEGNEEFPPTDIPSLYRVVGLPNDSIATEDDICIINGVKNESQFIGNVEFEEEYEFANEYEEELPNGLKIRIYSNSTMTDGRKNDMKAIKIPENHYFIMGDYRSSTIDSRYIGTAPIEKIVAKITKIHKK